MLTRLETSLLLVALLLVVIVLARHLLLRAPLSDDSAQGPDIESIVTLVRNSLWKLDQQRRDARLEPLFELDSFTLDLTFAVKESRSGSAGARLEILTVDSSKELSHEAVQRIQIGWKPHGGREGTSAPRTAED